MSATPQTATARLLAAPLSRRRFARLLPAGLATGLALTGGLAAARPGGTQGATLQTTSDLNLRSGPGMGYRVLLVIPKGARVFDRGEASNGFRKVTYNNTAGWASGQYLAAGTSVPPHAGPVIGNSVTTTDLNLRTGPSTGERVIRVLAKGSAVEITGTVVEGYRYVYHQGIGGWAADQYLGTGVPGDAPYDPRYARITAAVNLRSRPSASAQVRRVIPSGARVRLGAEAANGYRAVTYNGSTGFVATAYLN